MTKSHANIAEIDLGLEKRSIGDGRGRRTREIGDPAPETTIERETQTETGIKGTVGVKTRTGMATGINAEIQTTSDQGEIVIKTAVRTTIPETADDSRTPMKGGHEGRISMKLGPSRITSKLS